MKRHFVGVSLIAALLVVPVGSAMGESNGDQPVIDWEEAWERGYVAPDPSGLGDLDLQANDPLGLLPGIDFLRAHSLGPDVIDVWTCDDIGTGVGTIVDQLDADVVPYFAAHSGGDYQVDFVAKGAAYGGEQGCYETATDKASGNANGVLIAGPWSGGLATPGNNGESFPDNGRWALVGYPMAFSMVAAHELGHTITWPHSSTGVSGNDYDNAIDLMSGNFGTNGGTHPEPYDTAVINRYAAGWVDQDQVRILGSASTSFTLTPSPGSGLQMAVIKSGSSYYTLGARTRSTYDPIPDSWQGVEVYEVTPCPDSTLQQCFYDPDFEMGFRMVTPLGKIPWEYGSRPAHIIRPGSSKTVGGRSVSVTNASGGAYSVSVGEGSTVSFTDTSGHTFQSEIEWLAAAGITKGCNPPTNSRFCPNESVTRGQMAAFIHRALPHLAATGPSTDFRDDNGSTFEADIEWLAATGVTKGCNPPTNDRFCPDEVVTRGQMAAFIHRALPGLAATGPSTDFRDDNGSNFEADIEWLAATGVTRGCNPPTNDRFCPGDPVTRGAMAAFLNRALGG